MVHRGTFCYPYARPAVTVDCVVFGLSEDRLQLLLVQREEEPFLQCWGLPGGFVRVEEDLDESVQRELESKTGCKNIYFEQLYTFGSLDRDPRGRTISIAYFALVNTASYPVEELGDERSVVRGRKRVCWHGVDTLPQLAFDHGKIIACALERLRSKVMYRPIGFELLPSRFTLSRLQRMYEILLGRELDKRNFRKKILSMGVLDRLEAWEQNGVQRPAQLYRFNQSKYKQKLKQGDFFEV
jgi:8-oxo-dGTP diphosphatase